MHLHAEILDEAKEVLDHHVRLVLLVIVIFLIFLMLLLQLHQLFVCGSNEYLRESVMGFQSKIEEVTHLERLAAPPRRPHGRPRSSRSCEARCPQGPLRAKSPR